MLLDCVIHAPPVLNNLPFSQKLAVYIYIDICLYISPLIYVLIFFFIPGSLGCLITPIPINIDHKHTIYTYTNI